MHKNTNKQKISCKNLITLKTRFFKNRTLNSTKKNCCNHFYTFLGYREDP